MEEYYVIQDGEVAAMYVGVNKELGPLELALRFNTRLSAINFIYRYLKGSYTVTPIYTVKADYGVK